MGNPETKHDDGDSGIQLNESELKQLPLFSNQEITQALDSKLNSIPGFKASINFLNLSFRAARILHGMKVKSVEQALRITQDVLMKQRSFGIGSLREIQEKVWKYAVDNQSELDTSDMHYDASSLYTFPLFSNIPSDSLLPEHIKAGEREIAELQLPVRAENIIESLQIETIGELLCMTPSYLMKQRNCGRKTIQDIQNAIMILAHVGEHVAKNQPCNDSQVEISSLHAFPLFSDVELKNYNAEQIDTVFKGESDISELQLPYRAASILECQQIRTIRELLLTRCSYLMSRRNFGRKSLTQVRAAVEAFMGQENCGNYSTQVDYSSFHSFIEGSLSGSRINKRNLNIALTRMGLFSTEIPTLEEVAAIFHITRERVRQIEIKVGNTFGHPAVIRAQCIFWEKLETFMDKVGGVVGLADLSDQIRAWFNWKDPVPSHTLGCWLGLCSYTVDDKQSVVLGKETPCLNCKHLVTWLKDIMAEKKEVGYVFLESHIKTLCLSSCSSDATKNTYHTLDYFKYLLSCNHKLSKSIFLEDNVFLDKEKHTMLQGKTADAIALIFRQHRGPLHHTEATKLLNQLRPDEKYTERNIYALIDRMSELLMWGRGTYIHVDIVNPSAKFLHRVSHFIRAKLNKGAPFISIHGVYEHFSEECAKNKIPNDQALYSCLRQWTPLGMQFTHHPYIYSGRENEDKITITLFIEQFIQDSGEAVTVKEIYQHVKKRVLWDSPSEQHVLDKVPNVLKTSDGKYIHLCQLNRLSDATHDLIKTARQYVKAHSHVSVEKIWREKTVTSRMIGLRDPRMLFDYLRIHADGDLDISSYPLIRAGSDTHKAESISSIIVQYLLEQKRPISYQELEAKYVDQRGFKQNALVSALHRSEILNYSRQVYIHVNSLGWDTEKEYLLNQSVKNYYQKSCALGRPWGLIREFMEQAVLPSLTGGFVWTDCLFADILSLNKNVRYMGNERNAFVIIPNETKIGSFADLIAWILDHKFDGAAHLRDFSEYLNQQRIIHGELREGMLEDSIQLCIYGQQIILRRYAEHVRNT